MPLFFTKRHGFFPLLLLIFVLIPFLYQATLYYHYTNDDAYITYRYSLNFVQGIGPFFNAGEHVEGYTNFLQMLQTAAFMMLFGPVPIPGIAKFLCVLYGAGCIGLAFLIFWYVFSEKEPRLPLYMGLIGATAASAMVSISPSFAVNSTSGLETTMFTFFLCLGMLLGIRELQCRRWYGSGIAFALAELSRPEGIALYAAFCLGCLLAIAAEEVSGTDRENLFGRILRSTQFRLLLINCFIVIAVLLAHIAFRYIVYDGELLPNTYYAKQGGFRKVLPWQYIHNGLLAPVLGIGGLAAALAGFIISFRKIPHCLPCIAAVAIMGGLLPFIAGTDWMVGYRLMMPYLPAAAVLVAGGWVLLASRFKQFNLLLAAGILCSLLILAWFMQNKDRENMYQETLLRAKGYKTGHAAVAEWLRSEAKQGNTVALMDIGIIGYTCPELNILDTTGLTDRYIAKSEGSFLKKNYDPSYIFERTPGFIVLAFYTNGTPYKAPKAGTPYYPWTDIESRILKHPQFKQNYEKPRPNKTESSGGDWLKNFAASIGAEAAFEHGHPGLNYVLAIYRRQGQ